MKISKLDYRVPYADTDQMGVVYYANYLIYFERLRNELLRDAGLPYSEIESRGIMLPVIESYCKYHAPAHYDDLLSLSGWVEEVRGPRIRISCEVRRNRELLVSGYTVHACVGMLSRKAMRPPEELVSLAEE